MQIGTTMKAILWSGGIACWVVLAGCTKEEPIRRSLAQISATVIASDLGRSRDLFSLVPASVDGSFTSEGAVACFHEKSERGIRFLLQTDGGLRTCSGKFPAWLQPWARRQDVVAIICSDGEKILVLGDGTIWRRVDSGLPFRPLRDCSPAWRNNEAGCIDSSKSGRTLDAPEDLCESGSAGLADGG